MGRGIRNEPLSAALGDELIWRLRARGHRSRIPRRRPSGGKAGGVVGPTSTIPIVMVKSSDPVGLMAVASPSPMGPGGT